MNLKDIYVRDPYILLYKDIYYLYSKRQEDAREFVVYKSEDLEKWTEPETVFTPPETFWGESDFWAPEVYFYKDAFYMMASFKADGRCRGTQILRADKPDGRFVPVSGEAVTPSDWETLDGTLYIDRKGEPHIVFCHEWEQIGDGAVCEMKLSPDLSKAVSVPRVLWHASDFKGAVNACTDGRKSLVTDGPFLFREGQDELYCIWSTMSGKGYVVCLARSSNGEIDGEWTVSDMPLYEENGGHGMIFTDKNEKRCMVLHTPNIPQKERAVIYLLQQQEKKFVLKKREEENR